MNVSYQTVLIFMFPAKTYRHVRQYDVLQLVEESVGLEGVTVALED